MSDFPEIEPFGPRPTTHHGAQKTADQQSEPRAEPVQRLNITTAVITAFGIGFVLGYLVFRHEARILRQTRLDQFLDHANDWIREQGPKITDPIRQGFESTGSTVDQALKSTSSSVDDLIKKVKSRIFH